MLKLRRQLPVYSPIRPRSLLAGLGAALGFGRPWERLRRRLARHYGTPDLLLTDSGTSALHLAIRGALATSRSSSGSREGGVVALPAYCCPDVVTAAVGAGARVRLYDVDPATLGPDRESLEAALRAGVAAVVAVHLYGIPVDVERLAALAEVHGALLIEDAAQGFGGSVGGRPLGSLGSLGVLSFGRGKGITGGGGGALLANDGAGRRALDAVDDRLLAGGSGWIELGKLAAQWLFGRPSLYGLPAAIPWLGLGETRYEEPWAPRGLSRAAAAAVLSNWEASLEEAKVRRGNAERLVAALGEEFAIPSPDISGDDAEAGALRKPILAPDEPGGGTETSTSARLRTMGIEPGYPDLWEHPNLEDYDMSGTDCSGALALTARLRTLPTHSRSNAADTVNVVRRGC